LSILITAGEIKEIDEEELSGYSNIVDTSSVGSGPSTSFFVSLTSSSSLRSFSAESFSSFFSINFFTLASNFLLISP